MWRTNYTYIRYIFGLIMRRRCYTYNYIHTCFGCLCKCVVHVPTYKRHMIAAIFIHLCIFQVESGLSQMFAATSETSNGKKRRSSEVRSVCVCVCVCCSYVCVRVSKARKQEKPPFRYSERPACMRARANHVRNFSRGHMYVRKYAHGYIQQGRPSSK
jgi:hypothetical protein